MTDGMGDGWHQEPVTFPWEGGAFTFANIRKFDLMQLRWLAKGAPLPLRLTLRAFQPPANRICPFYGICDHGNMVQLRHGFKGQSTDTGNAVAKPQTKHP